VRREFHDFGVLDEIQRSHGGCPRSPGWYHNLIAAPDVEINVGPKRFGVQAQPVLPGDPDRERGVEDRHQLQQGLPRIPEEDHPIDSDCRADRSVTLSAPACENGTMNFVGVSVKPQSPDGCVMLIKQIVAGAVIAALGIAGGVPCAATSGGFGAGVASAKPAPCPPGLACGGPKPPRLPKIDSGPAPKVPKVDLNLPAPKPPKVDLRLPAPKPPKVDLRLPAPKPPKVDLRVPVPKLPKLDGRGPHLGLPGPAGKRGDFRLPGLPKANAHVDLRLPRRVAADARGAFPIDLGKPGPWAKVDFRWPGLPAPRLRGDFRVDLRKARADFRSSFGWPGKPPADFRTDFRVGFRWPGLPAVDLRLGFPVPPPLDIRPDYRWLRERLLSPPWRGGVAPWGLGPAPWGWGPPPPPAWTGFLPPPGAPAPPPFTYWGYTVYPVWDPDFAQWGFWLFGLWVPLTS
jgi:F420H(2)-dependent quinone reductase